MFFWLFFCMFFLFQCLAIFSFSISLWCVSGETPKEYLNVFLSPFHYISRFASLNRNVFLISFLLFDRQGNYFQGVFSQFFLSIICTCHIRLMIFVTLCAYSLDYFTSIFIDVILTATYNKIRKNNRKNFIGNCRSNIFSSLKYFFDFSLNSF